MAENKKPTSDPDKTPAAKENRDPFIVNSVYPEAAQVFSRALMTLDAVKDTCVVVLDTNTLLLPYTIGPQNLSVIRQTYQALADSKRLVVPGQVAREFAKNRATKLGEVYQQLSRRKSAQLVRGKYPLLEDEPDYVAAVELEKQIDALMGDYQKAMGKVLDKIRSWIWDDPVSRMYRDIFTTDVVVDIQLDRDQLMADSARRRAHFLPPGYKDESIGDLIIWHTILELGRRKSSDLLFVSHDEKADWFHQSEGQSLYPRYELVDEFARASNGKSFHIARLSRLLELSGAKAAVVAEITEEEASSIEGATSSADESRDLSHAFDEDLRSLENRRRALDPHYRAERLWPTQTSQNSARVSGRILVVEPAPDTAAALKGLLEQVGHQVTVANNFSAAMFAGRKRYHDVMISELRLPEGNGWDLLRVLRPNVGTAIAMTTDFSSDAMKESLDAGFVLFLPRPIVIDKLISAVELLMRS